MAEQLAAAKQSLGEANSVVEMLRADALRTGEEQRAELQQLSEDLAATWRQADQHANERDAAAEEGAAAQRALEGARAETEAFRVEAQRLSEEQQADLQQQSEELAAAQRQAEQLATTRDQAIQERAAAEQALDEAHRAAEGFGAGADQRAAEHRAEREQLAAELSEAMEHLGRLAAERDQAIAAAREVKGAGAEVADHAIAELVERHRQEADGWDRELRSARAATLGSEEQLEAAQVAVATLEQRLAEATKQLEAAPQAGASKAALQRSVCDAETQLVQVRGENQRLKLQLQEMAEEVIMLHSLQVDAPLDASSAPGAPRLDRFEPGLELELPEQPQTDPPPAPRRIRRDTVPSSRPPSPGGSYSIVAPRSERKKRR